MSPNPLDTLPMLLQKSLPLLLSCLGEVLVLDLSRLGIPLPGLQWLRFLLLSATAMYWGIRRVSYCYRRYRHT